MRVSDLIIILQGQPPGREVFTRDENGERLNIIIAVTESLQLVIGPYCGIHDRDITPVIQKEK